MSSTGSVEAAIHRCTTAEANRRFQAKRADFAVRSQEFRTGSLSATLN